MMCKGRGGDISFQLLDYGRVALISTEVRDGKVRKRFL